VLGIAQLRPWEQRGFFLRVGMGVGFAGNAEHLVEILLGVSGGHGRAPLAATTRGHCRRPRSSRAGRNDRGGFR
jgi:hypothetical protein